MAVDEYDSDSDPQSSDLDEESQSDNSELDEDEDKGEMHHPHPTSSYPLVYSGNDIIEGGTLARAPAHLDATNAQWALTQSRLELENVKKKKQPRKSVKLWARFMTHLELEEDFNKVEEEQREKDKAEAEKQAKKKSDDEICLAQIEHDIQSKTFDTLSTLQRKDDFIMLAGALKISRDGTVDELRARIKEFLANAENRHFADNPCFSALFQTGKTCSKNSATASSTGQASTSSTSQDNGANSNLSNAVASGSASNLNHFFTSPAHPFNSNYPSHLANQPYFHQFHTNPALHAPYHASMQNNNPSSSPIASSSNLHRQPQIQPGHPYNAHGFPIQFYNYGTHSNQPHT
ncbi:hypothetical protein EDD22DRAFT_958180 [Suillus occidentalis]|nr:hypothetical protein EDD22DRAFT_958180 [Suillus occidentalis]